MAFGDGTVPLPERERWRGGDPSGSLPRPFMGQLLPRSHERLVRSSGAQDHAADGLQQARDPAPRRRENCGGLEGRSERGQDAAQCSFPVHTDHSTRWMAALKALSPAYTTPFPASVVAYQPGSNS